LFEPDSSNDGSKTQPTHTTTNTKKKS